jgi:hypothetical protein
VIVPTIAGNHNEILACWNIQTIRQNHQKITWVKLKNIMVLPEFQALVKVQSLGIEMMLQIKIIKI